LIEDTDLQKKKSYARLLEKGSFANWKSPSKSGIQNSLPLSTKEWGETRSCSAVAKVAGGRRREQSIPHKNVCEKKDQKQPTKEEMAYILLTFRIEWGGKKLKGLERN